MAFDDPARLDLGALFRDEDMFDSRRAWSSSGFRVNDRSNNGKIMVASHPSASGLLAVFKELRGKGAQPYASAFK